VFGQIKQARGFRQFLLRGIDKLAGEWAMVCTAHNLTKLFHRGGSVHLNSPALLLIPSLGEDDSGGVARMIGC
jgi:hypothetical protein